MPEFIRHLDQSLMEKLRGEKLFNDRLLPDIRNGKVFPAIRNNRVDFYYSGGKLFAYTTEGFVTHVKYASVMTGDRPYVSESGLESLSRIESFVDAYNRIKENCARYSGPEAQGVSSTFRAFGDFVRGEEQCIIPLDIEISFAAAEADPDAAPFEADSSIRTMDRIDILFLNTSKGVLRFCEAKHFSNSELWASEGEPPKVVGQLQRYEVKIREREETILAEYKKYVGLLNQLLGTSILEPKSIDSNISVFLLVFGFDRDQLNGRLGQLLLEDGSLNSHHYYAIGGINRMVLCNMWNGARLGQ